MGGKTCKFSDFPAEKKFELKEKGYEPNQAEKYFSLSYGSSHLGLDSSLLFSILKYIYIYQLKDLHIIFNPIESRNFRLITTTFFRPREDTFLCHCQNAVLQSLYRDWTTHL